MEGESCPGERVKGKSRCFTSKVFFLAALQFLLSLQVVLIECDLFLNFLEVSVNVFKRPTPVDWIVFQAFHDEFANLDMQGRV